MVKHTQTIRLQQSTNCLSVFGHFVGLGLKELTWRKFGEELKIYIYVVILQLEDIQWFSFFFNFQTHMNQPKLPFYKHWVNFPVVLLTVNNLKPFKRQLHKIVKHTICRLLLKNCLSVFDQSVRSTLKALRILSSQRYI